MYIHGESYFRFKLNSCCIIGGLADVYANSRFHPKRLKEQEADLSDLSASYLFN